MATIKEANHVECLADELVVLLAEASEKAFEIYREAGNHSSPVAGHAQKLAKQLLVSSNVEHEIGTAAALRRMASDETDAVENALVAAGERSS